MSTGRRVGSMGVAFGFAVSGIFLWFFLRNVEWSDLGASLMAVDLKTMGLCLAGMVVVYLARALRWCVLLRPVAPVGYMRSLSALLIGFGANCILPARAGEFVRAAALAARTPVRWSAAFATIVVERVVDVVGILVILAWVLARLPGEAGLDDPYGLVPRLHSFAWIFGVTVVLVLVTLLTMATWPDGASRIMHRLTSFLPEAVQGRILGMLDAFCEGLHVVRSLRLLLLAQALTFVVWGASIVVAWCLFDAFGIESNWTAAGLVFIATAAAVALPQAPSFVGVYHVACEAALSLFAVHGTTAKGYAIVLWAVQVIPIFLAGLFFLQREGLSLRRLRRQGASAEEEGPLEDGDGAGKGEVAIP